jgi:hypothetical protein
LNVPDFVVCEIGIEWNRKCRSVRFVAVRETRLIQIPMERSKDGLAAVNPLLLQGPNKTRQTLRLGSEMRESNYKSIVSMGPAWRLTRTDDGLGGQDISIGCREEPTPFMKGRESPQLGKPERRLQVGQLEVE